MTPIVNGLADDYANELSVYQLDAAQPAIATLQQRYGLRGHPSFALLTANGNVNASFFGPQDEQLLRDAIEALLAE